MVVIEQHAIPVQFDDVFPVQHRPTVQQQVGNTEADRRTAVIAECLVPRAEAGGVQVGEKIAVEIRSGLPLEAQLAFAYPLVIFFQRMGVKKLDVIGTQAPAFGSDI